MGSEYREDGRARCAVCTRPLASADVRYERDGSVACAPCIDARVVADASRVVGSIERSWLRDAAVALSRVMRKAGW